MSGRQKQTPSRVFSDSVALQGWLRANHATESELWVQIYKKGSGTPSVNWQDCVLAALAWGWIDGQRRAHDEESFMQRLTPRRAKSSWSRINCGHADKLIADGRMQAPGLKQVEAAKADGRWDRAYSGSREMVMPEAFLAALSMNKAAAAFYATLDRKNQFAIYHRLGTAKKPETQAKRIAEFVAKLARGEKFHG